MSDSRSDHDCPWTRTPAPFGAPFCSICDERSEAAYEELLAECERVLESKNPTLYLTRDEAAQLRDRIIDMNWKNDSKTMLRAHDLLHNRVIHGRAF